ncbi:hypothetical protein CW304_18055 [Bacillus sp. UFRGS-B20]|nr:hypothetical protein CW304_18055 [Bacillus sp. UFRGS-B20]
MRFRHFDGFKRAKITFIWNYLGMCFGWTALRFLKIRRCRCFLYCAGWKLIIQSLLKINGCRSSRCSGSPCTAFRF